MKTFLRILLSPFIFLYGIFLLFAGTMLPLPIIVIYSFVGMISIPFIYMCKKADINIDYIEPFNSDGGMCDYKPFYNFKEHFYMVTVYIWLPFWAVYIFVKHGEIAFINDNR